MSIKELKSGGTMSLNEAEYLMVQFQSGDKEALEEIYRVFKEPLYRFVYRYTGDEQFSIDIVQDTFVHLQRKKKQYSPEKGKFKTYLFQIAYHTMVTKLNRRKHFYRLFPFLAEITPYRESISHEERMTVQAAIQALPTKLRGVILLAYYHDLPQKDIASILQIPVGTVKSRHFHALKQLKLLMGVSDDEKSRGRNS